MRYAVFGFLFLREFTKDTGLQLHPCKGHDFPFYGCREEDLDLLCIVPSVQLKEDPGSQNLVQYKKWPWDKPFCRTQTGTVNGCAAAMSQERD